MRPTPPEPRFLVEGPLPIAKVLLLDFMNFVAILVFYACSWIFGGAAFMLDNMFRTELFERYIRFVEWVDQRL